MRRIVIAAMLAAAVMPASAQKPEKPWKPPTSVAGKVAFLAEAVDQKPLAKLQTGKLAKDAKTTITFPVTQPGYLTVIGACADGCERLDLMAVNDSGRFLAQRTNAYADAMLSIDPDGARSITVEVTMYSCPKAQCQWGVNLYGYRQPVMPAAPKPPKG